MIAHAVGDGSNDSKRGYRTYDPAGVVGRFALVSWGVSAGGPCLSFGSSLAVDVLDNATSARRVPCTADQVIFLACGIPAKATAPGVRWSSRLVARARRLSQFNHFQRDFLETRALHARLARHWPGACRLAAVSFLTMSIKTSDSDRSQKALHRRFEMRKTENRQNNEEGQEQ